MFAYCLNNPVVLADNSGNAAHICFGYDRQRDESPWKIGSPGGGGWPQDIHYSQQDYGTVADKFYTVRVAQFVGNQIAYSAHKLWDAYVYSVSRASELGYPQYLAITEFGQYVFRSPRGFLEFAFLTYSNVSLCIDIIGVLTAPQIVIGKKLIADIAVAFISTYWFFDDIS